VLKQKDEQPAVAMESEQKRREELEALVLSLKQVEAIMGTMSDCLPVQSDEIVEATTVPTPEGIQIAASFAIDSAPMHTVETRATPLADAMTEDPESHATSEDADMQDMSPSDPK
jgi:hypothetical protein